MKRVSLILAFGLVVLAQVPNRKPAFEVASIKLDPATGGNATLADQPGGRFVANHITLRRVIQFAYRDNQQFLGGPDWLDTDRWNLEAKAPDGTVPPRASAFSMAVPDTTALMMQSLLEDRFGALPQQWLDRIEQTTSADALKAALVRVSKVDKLENMSL